MKVKKLTSLSIFFPCYNDAKSIAGLVTAAYTVGKQVAKEIEVIVIDDGSSDSSRRVLKSLQKHTYPELHLIFHEENRGYGGALRSGFASSSKDWVFYTDGDGQYDVKDLKVLVEHATKKIDVINGKKYDRHDAFIRDLAATCYYWWIKSVFKTPIAEIDTDFRLIRAKKLKAIQLTKDSGAICVELIAKLARAGSNFIEVPVNHYDRKYGQSQFFKPKRIIKTLWEDVVLWWQLHHR